MRLFRIARSNPPTPDDFKSYWDLGRRPPRNQPRQVRTYQAVSTFNSIERAREKARRLNLGEWVVELDVPEKVEREVSSNGHVDLYSTTPAQLEGYVLAIHPVEE